MRFEFNEPVLKTGKPVFGSNSIKIDIPGAFVRPVKRFYYTDDLRIPQIFVSQHNSRTLRLQFVLGEKLPLIKDMFQVEDQGRSLVFHIFKKKEDVLSEFLARAANRIDSPEDQKEATKPLPDPASLKSSPAPLEDSSRAFIADKAAADSPFKKVSEKTASSGESIESKTTSTPPINSEKIKEPDGGGPLDLVSITVKTFTMFALVLALMFLVFYLFKKYVLKNSIFGGNEKIIRVLGTGFLGPKKNIVLVEVAGEILVLGTSNDNISLLTHIQDKDKIEKIKASGKSVGAGKFWNPPKESELAPEPPAVEPTKSVGAFVEYLNQYSELPSVKEKSVDEVTDLIRKNLEKLKAL